VQVASGVLEQDAKALLAPFASSMTKGRPWVTLKMAVSLDGKIADASGRSKWITGPEAREAVQELRRRSDAIMVGATTARKDDPSLLPRPARGREPYRIVVDSTGRLTPAGQLFSDEARERTIVATTARCPVSRREAYAACGAQVWCLPAAAGRVSLKAVIRKLHGLGVLQVLVEGGGEVAAALLRTGWVDELVWFVAPVVIGGPGVQAVGGQGWPLAKAPRMKVVETRPMGADVMIRAIPR
jgi:diaminohydroxyphosphoribosylaminopyrimidine deaminase/5-amino-6-(5-phosphoribosylamino)uracil reductase